MTTFLFLTEDNRIDFIVSKQGEKIQSAAQNDVSARNFREPAQVVQKILSFDPTKGKALQFLVNKYIAKEFRIEDGKRVQDALTAFVKKRNVLEKKDINQYKSLHDLYDAVEAAPEAEVSKRQQEKQIKVEGTEAIFKKADFIILRLITAEAATFYAAGTKWCTSAPSTFESYARQGPIFVIMVKDGGATRKFQMHYHSGQIMDEKDRNITKTDIALLSKHQEWYKFVDMLVKKHWSALK